MKITSLTFSGLPGAGKSTLLNEVAKKTGWEVHHIGSILRKMHIKWQEESSKNVKNFSDWYRDKNLVTRETIKFLNDEAREKLKKGNLILDSRFGTLNSIGVNTCLNVFLTAPLQTRLHRRFSSQGVLKKEEILEDLTSRENSEVLRGKEFHQDFVGNGEEYDYRNTDLYDLVINTKNLTVEQETKIIMDLLSQ